MFFVSSSFSTFSNSHYKRQDVYDFQYKGRNINAAYAGDGYNSSKNGFVSVGFNDQLTGNQSLGATYTSQDYLPVTPTRTTTTMYGKVIFIPSLIQALTIFHKAAIIT